MARLVLVTTGLLALLGLGPGGCASGPRGHVMRAIEQRDVTSALGAYDRYRERDGPDGSLLAHVAVLVLQQEALEGDDEARDAAIDQLQRADEWGTSALERVVREAADPVTRAKALEALAKAGYDGARERLYGMLDHEASGVRAAAISVARADADRDRLIGWLQHTSGEVREAAALRLAGAAPDARGRLALAEAARVDPLPRVRGAAIRALGAYGPEAVEAIRGRLGDPEPRVRLATVRALVRADRTRALGVIESLLATQPSPAGIEAARVLAVRHDPAEEQSPARDVVDARAYLKRAVEAGTASLRAQAAVALASLPPEPARDETLTDALKKEKEPRVRLQLARVLLRRDAPEVQERAREALTELMAGDGIPAVQSAAILAERGDEAAVRRLDEALADDDALLRQVAARALAQRAERPDMARRALRDSDASVRIHAAGGILAAAG